MFNKKTVETKNKTKRKLFFFKYNNLIFFLAFHSLEKKMLFLTQIFQRTKTFLPYILVKVLIIKKIEILIEKFRATKW